MQNNNNQIWNGPGVTVINAQNVNAQNVNINAENVIFQYGQPGNNYWPPPPPPNPATLDPKTSSTYNKLHQAPDEYREYGLAAPSHAGYKLGAFVQFPLAAVHYLTADNVWEKIVNEPRNAEITVFGQKWEQWAFGDGLVVRYRASDERVTIPRTAPLCWLVARVAHWFQRADHGFLLIAELPDFSQHELQNDKDWRDIAEQTNGARQNVRMRFLSSSVPP
ncbi:hypothetical protein FN846DRAFT_914862 [Sphaerosporella brunnea]|uniref:Uncharacterized protein n=1 Tax=Sphaerosporella brunnea TaxID=1250544 RepID=A0A5J5EC46_9PEZI|nr:hypothetical protein FN846DRAFT_914862 [Sphaerosporella brunnea]